MNKNINSFGMNSEEMTTMLAEEQRYNLLKKLRQDSDFSRGKTIKNVILILSFWLPSIYFLYVAYGNYKTVNEQIKRIESKIR